MAKPLAQEAITAYGLEAVCADIANRESLTGIAGKIDVSIGSLLTWIESDPERSARVREARIATARLWDEQAEFEIRAAEDDLGMRKAKELAHHYRWRAAKISPRDYGDKITHANDPEAPFGRLTDEEIERKIREKLGASNG